MVVNVVIFIKMRCVVLTTDGPEDGTITTAPLILILICLYCHHVNIDHYYHT